MAWLYLFLAGIFEVVWSTAMKESHGFTRLIPSLITVFFMLLSVVLLAIAMKTLPLGTSYTVWVGIGAIGAFILGVTMFGESINPLRVIAVLLIFAGLILLKVATKE
ncbi:DMT family transporter [Rahnella sp. PCH160]|uniref:DMT family transporter n=1 Tax=Rahnella sp. PCH160 TaxID=3447928 RepID=UPI0039FC5CFA